MLQLFNNNYFVECNNIILCIKNVKTKPIISHLIHIRFIFAVFSEYFKIKYLYICLYKLFYSVANERGAIFYLSLFVR